MTARLLEPALAGISVLECEHEGDSVWSAIAQSPLSCGQGRRGVTSTMALRLLLVLQKLINRFANQPRDRNVFAGCRFLQLLYLLKLEPNGYEFLSHTSDRKSTRL